MSTALGQQEIIDALRGGLKHEVATGQVLMFVLGAILLVILLVAAKRLFSREDRKPEVRIDYLAEAIAILDLTRSEREDVRRLAARARLPQPVSMLLSPANLAYGLARAFPDGGGASMRERIEALCMKLFGCPLPHDHAEPGSGDTARSSISSR